MELRYRGNLSVDNVAERRKPSGDDVRDRWSFQSDTGVLAPFRYAFAVRILSPYSCGMVDAFGQTVARFAGISALMLPSVQFNPPMNTDSKIGLVQTSSRCPMEV